MQDLNVNRTLLKSEEPFFARPVCTRRFLLLNLLLLAIGFIVLIVGIVLIHKRDGAACSIENNGRLSYCAFSAEARRVGLPGLLVKIEEAYFELKPNEVPSKPYTGDTEKQAAYVRERYAPYNPSPNHLKTTTDRSRSLLKELKALKVNGDLLKPRENKVIAQATHFLQHSFGLPYDGNYYAGDWMLGPNLFCWQPICYLGYHLKAYGTYAVPRTYDDVTKVINTIKSHRHVFTSYRKNMEVGVRSGMVGSITSCRAGVTSYKNRFKMLTRWNQPSAFFEEIYTKPFTSAVFLANLDSGVAQQWSKDNKQNITESIKEALIDGFAQPILEFVAFLEFEHSRHCPPDSVTSGLSELPLQYVWVDGKPDKSRPTSRTLPNGEPLDGKKAYRSILEYFTASDVKPDKIYAEGLEQLNIFMPQAIRIAKEVSGISDDAAAIKAFVKRLNASDQWYNSGAFPANESNENAHKVCVDSGTAKMYCPKRWEAFQKWSRDIALVVSMINPKLYSLFYYSGPKTTTGNCPIEFIPHFHPGSGTFFFQAGGPRCSKPAYIKFPFFLNKYGPKYKGWTMAGHETRPGHYTQLQGHYEHFQDKCGGIATWLDSKTSFHEGWALYAENPLLSDDVNLYHDNKLQKYGMLKWQIWRAVRIVVDTGLHYRGMKRSEALELFANYTWDKNDYVFKEVTRYQTVPGQATGYMQGRLEIIKLRRKAEKELGFVFDIREFHYQVLSQGSAPISHLRAHVDRWIRCAKGKLKGDICDMIMTSSADKHDVKASQEQLPLLPSQRYYY